MEGLALTSNTLVGSFTHSGSFIYNKYKDSDGDKVLINQLLPREKIINKFMKDFFAETQTLRTCLRNEQHLGLPYTHPGAFIDLLISQISTDVKYTMIKKYVNLVTLDKKMRSENEQRKELWGAFIKSLKVNPDDDNELVDLSTVKLDDPRQLVCFIKAIVDAPDVLLHIIIASMIDENVQVYTLPHSYEVYDKFGEALYLNKYIS